MADADKEVIETLKDFASQAWGYDDDKARMAAEILWQCRKSIIAGGVAGGALGAYAGLGIFSIPGWAIGAFGGIALGGMACTGFKSPSAMGMHQVTQTSQNSTPIMDMSLLVAQHRGNTRLKQEMDVLVDRRAGKSSV